MRPSLFRAPVALFALALAMSVAPPLTAADRPAPGAVGQRRAGLDRPHERPRASARHRLARLAQDPDASAGRALAAVRRSMLEVAGLDDLFLHEDEDDDEYVEVAAVPAGDLDGDGGEDLLEYTYRYSWETDEESLSFSGVKGVSGQTLWSRPPASDFEVAVPAGDLDGQPGDDLLAISLVFDDGFPLSQWLITYSAIRGGDGSTIWSRTVQNDWTALGVLGAEVYVDRDFAVPQDVAGDMDGDGAAEMLIGRYDYTVVWAGPVEVWEVEVRFEALSGRTGDPVFSRTETSSEPWPEVWALALEDVTGDGLDDVAVANLSWRDDYDDLAGAVAAYGGASGQALWSRSVSGAWWIDVWGFPLDGDDRGDVLITLVRDEGFSEATDLIAVSGPTGSTMWSLAVPGDAWPTAAGDATGDGGQELLVRSWEYAYDWETDEETETAHLALLEGSTGAALWSRSESSGEGEGGVGWGIPGDLDGDGVLDALATRYEITCESFEDEDEDEDWCRYTPVGDREALSGRDAAVLWTRAAGDAWVFGVGDLDGDGASELVELVDEAGPEDRWISRYVALSGPTGGDLWSEPVVAEELVWDLASAALRGGPGRDLVESLETLVVARAGDSASELWRRSMGAGPQV